MPVPPPQSGVRRITLAVAGAALALTAPGCGEQDAAFVAVAGTVTYDGRPLGGALLSFYPDESHPGLATGQGRTPAEGKYRARTGNVPGLRPGVYMATVTAGLRPHEAKIGDSLRLYGSVRCRVPSTGGEVNLDLNEESRG